MRVFLEARFSDITVHIIFVSIVVVGSVVVIIVVVDIAVVNHITDIYYNTASLHASVNRHAFLKFNSKRITSGRLHKASG